MSSIDEYDILEEIGRGTYGVVYKAQLKLQSENHEVFAIKKINFTKANVKELEHLSREESILKDLCKQRHENIVRYVASFTTGSVLYVVTEYCPGGSLHNYLRRLKTGLDEHEFKLYLEQILNGVKYLHSKNITHRDLKTKNILLTSDSRIKIADFGVAKDWSCCKVAVNTVYVGTMHYIAPEMADGSGNYNEKIDIWAIGCDCYEMGTSKYAFEGRNAEELMETVTKKKLPNMNNLHFCYTLQKMILRMLAFDPAERPDAATLYDEISRHRCHNLNPPPKSHKQTQVFSHSTAIPGQTKEGVFLSSQDSRISTISRDFEQEKEPTQNTDSFEKPHGEMLSQEEQEKEPTQNTDSFEKPRGGMVTLDVSRSLSRDFNGGKRAMSGEQNTDSFADSRKSSSSSSSSSSVSKSLPGDFDGGKQGGFRRSRKSSSSSIGDSHCDICSEYRKSLDKFDKILYNTLVAESGRDVYRQLGPLLLEDCPREQFTHKVEGVLGERFAWLRSLVLTVKDLEDGVREYSNK